MEHIKNLSIQLDDGTIIREFTQSDFPGVQSLYEKEGWLTFINRSDEALEAWKNSTISLVVINNKKVIGLLRALSDRQITTYLSEIIVDQEFRGRGIARSLINMCYELYPNTRIDLLSSSGSNDFYEHEKFRKMMGFRKSALEK